MVAPAILREGDARHLIGKYRHVMTRRAWAFDVLVAVAVLVPGQLDAWLGIGTTHRQGPHWAEALALGVAAALLVVRRVNPLACMAGITATFVLEFAVFGSPEGNGVALAPLVAAYSVGRWEGRRRPVWGLVLTLALGAAWIALDPMDTTLMTRVQGTFWISPWVIAWLVGSLVRSRAQSAEQRRLRRADQAQRAVAEERNRIARELHDVIGHSVSVMTVQASAVRRRLTPDQAAERQALESVEAVGREALTEMRRMVGVLRDADAAGNREPPPSLDQLGRLVDKFRSAGLPVELVITGDALPLAPGLDLTAYRLVQEGLTNALRHAVSPQRTEVSIAYADKHLELAVRDDGQSARAPDDVGHGLLGMRERVSVYGGQLVARPRAEGGFELLATLPLALS
jgi:signal transduction histidine kinase